MGTGFRSVLGSFGLEIQLKGTAQLGPRQAGVRRWQEVGCAVRGKGAAVAGVPGLRGIRQLPVSGAWRPRPQAELTHGGTPKPVRGSKCKGR